LLEKLIHWTVFLVHVHELEQWKPPLFFSFKKKKVAHFDPMMLCLLFYTVC